MSRPPSVVELRRYLLHPGRREELIGLFDRQFIESQEQVGMVVIGQFRDVDRPDYFVWLRGFDGMAERRTALARFYGGPVWAEHRDAANATMIDSDDVLLLRPLPLAGRRFQVPPRVASGEPAEHRRVAFATMIYNRIYSDPAALAHGVQTEVMPALIRAGAVVLGMLETEPAANTYPALPVRDDADVLVVLAAAPDLGRLDAALSAAPPVPAGRSAVEPEVLRLLPTSRSRLNTLPSSGWAMPVPHARSVGASDRYGGT